MHVPPQKGLLHMYINGVGATSQIVYVYSRIFL